MKYLHNFSHLFTRKSLFTRIFISLAVLFFVLLCLVFFFINQIAVQNNRERSFSSHINVLIQSEKILSTNLEILAQNMDQILWSDEYISYMMNSSEDDPERDYQIIQALVSLEENYSLVKSAWFYSPISGCVYQGNYDIGLAENFPDQEELSRYYENWNVVPLQREESSLIEIDCFYHEERMFIGANLHISKDMGLLMCELDLDAINLLLGNTEDYQNIFLFDSYHHCISNTDTLWPLFSSFLTERSSQEEIQSTLVGYYLYESTLTGWKYIIPLDEDYLSVHLMDILPLYVPSMILLFLVSLFLAYSIGRAVYRPINRIMKLVTADSTEPELPKSQDEIRFLEEAYSAVLQSKSQFSQLLEQAMPQLMRWVYRDLLFNADIELEHMQFLSPILQSQRDIHKYITCAVYAQGSEEREISSEEKNIYILALGRLFNNYSHPDYELYYYHMEDTILALVLVFSAQLPDLAIRQKYDQLYQYLKKESDSLPFQVVMVGSNIRSHPRDIRGDYQNAFMKLNYFRYSAQERVSGDAAPEDSLHITDRYYLRGRTEEILSAIRQEKKDDALAIASHVVEDTIQGSQNFEDFRNLMQIFLVELLQKVSDCHLSPREKERLTSITEQRGLKDCDSLEDAVQYIQHYYTEMIELLSQNLHKNQYLYIEKAREFIAAHYDDSNCSVVMIADAVGISASYLNRLFNEAGLGNVSSYLATYRIDRAKTMLSGTELSIKEIGFCCGFNSSQNFIRVFRKYAQRTPGQYRAENK